MSNLAAYPPDPVYKDRSAGLIVIGILEICLGLLCLLLVALTTLAALSLAASPAGQPAGVNPRAILGSGLIYLLATAFFMTLGVGTLRGRRWARTIGLVCSWIGLIGGVFSTAVAVFLLPRMMAGVTAAAGPNVNPSYGTFMTGCVAVFLLLIYVVLPGILLLFYRGANVKATFEAKDPSIPWTDRVPAPVLALTLLLLFAGMRSLIGLSYRVFPVFGTLLTGAPAVLGFLAIGALCLALAWGIYHQRPAAWWAVTLFWAVGCVNGFLFLRMGSSGLRKIYEGMGMPAVQLEQIEKMGIYEIFTNPAILALMVLAWLGALGFLIWTRRFFIGAPESA